MPLAVCLSIMMLLAAAVPAATNTVDGGGHGTDAYYTWSGYTPCTDGSTMEVSSWASGTVYHSVDGMTAGVFYNGTMMYHNVGYAPSYAGNWLVETWDGYINSASAYCLHDGGGHDDDDDDGGGGDGGGGDGDDPPPRPCDVDYRGAVITRCPIEE